MSSIDGRISGAFSSIRNENNVSLANLNIDFALWKVEAPAEFQYVGRALTQNRRKVAEDGTHHRTARCLGALFATVIPPSPRLVKAFGSRASEILKSPHANPKGTAKDGPFAEYVGADATSIWASATSGISAIAVLLLACMLARKFDDSRYSVAIWVELVNARQKDLVEYAQANGSITDQVVAEQRILREDLALFDDSVRAWLNTADAVMLRQRKQLDLILHNLTSVPVSSGGTTYKKVLKAWRDAMEGFEALLEGKPQNATETSVLLALSAWHLYPNLIVLSDRTIKVDFEDHLIPQSGAITVGLQLSDVKDSTPGFRWSLALSHLKYYGEAVKVEMENDNVRINIHELCVIAFGALLRKWKVAHTATAVAAECIQEIGSLLRNANLNTSNDWFHGILSAAQSVTVMLKDEAKRCDKLIKFGRRRYKNFFSGSTAPSSGLFFGLSNPHILKAMTLPPGRERELLYCRSQLADFEREDAVVFFYRQQSMVMGTHSIDVIATIRPLAHVARPNETTNQDRCRGASRWVYVRGITDSGWNSMTDGEILSQLEIPDDEIVEIIRESADTGFSPPDLDKWGFGMTWHHAPSIFRCPQCSPACTTGTDGENRCAYLDCSMSEGRMEIDPVQKEAIFFKRVCGTELRVSLYVTNHQYSCLTQSEHESDHESERESEYESELLEYMQAETVRVMKPDTFLSKLKQDSLNQQSLAEYFHCLSKFEILTSGEAAHVTMASKQRLDWCNLLKRLDMGQGGLSVDERDLWSSVGLISTVFEKLPGSTFPIKVADRQFPKIESYGSGGFGHGTRENLSLGLSFACIAAMESGGVPMSPALFRNAFALSIGNSLYAARCLLEDPLASTPSHEVKRILGNLGRPGLSILVSPEAPRIKDKTSFHAVEHAIYNGRRVNSFEGVSLHLSLTEWKVPYQHDSIGLIDQDIFTTEAVISVHDRGEWYADIDVLQTLPCIQQAPSCSCTAQPQFDLEETPCVSIDNFDELLDFPQEALGIVRAHQHWAARLAACCIIRQRLNPTQIYVLGDQAPCPICIASSELSGRDFDSQMEAETSSESEDYDPEDNESEDEEAGASYLPMIIVD